MAHKPIRISVIVSLTVVAILILGMLSGISSTAAAQLSKTVKTPHVSKTVKTPYVSKTVKMPYVSKTVKMGATKTPYRTAGNGKKRTELTISASPNGPAKAARPGYSFSTWVPVILSGRLTSEGSGVAGAMILFDCDGEPCYGDKTVHNPTASYTGRISAVVQAANTDSGGHYSVGALLPDHKYTTKIEASYLGDQIANEHLHLQSSDASIKVK